MCSSLLWPGAVHTIATMFKWIDGRLGGYWRSWLYNQLIKYRKIRANKVFALMYLYLLGGLEQIHSCERSYGTPSHRSRWNNIQHGELLHSERYLTNIKSVCSHDIIEIWVLTDNGTEQQPYSPCVWWSLVKIHICICAERSVLQHHPSATDQANTRRNPGGNHRAVHYSLSGQDQTILLPQLRWAEVFMFKSKLSLDYRSY